VIHVQKMESSNTLAQQNSYPLNWHFEHMQKTVVKYVSGIPDNATSFQKKIHRKYNGRLDMSAGISTLISNMVLQEKKSLHFLIKSKMIPHFLTYENVKVAKKVSKNCR
jgi:hypothetical protein